MLSPLPGVIAWPVIGYTAVLIAGRLLLFRDTIADQFLNRILLWCLLSLLLYRCTWTPGIAHLGAATGHLLPGRDVGLRDRL
ncbi:hypothetical protein [Nocardia pneumoniae]|uniref:hypothetical protein n=1 Tax=Nocardia pneumoniae TaxID=228601 RepID=UPI0012F6AA52|nr:hypothetical protein [Nocardia pneumoniae]